MTMDRNPVGQDLLVAAADSPLAEAVGRVGDRWSLLLVDALLDGPRRFGDLQAAVAGVAPNVLSRRLKDLVAEGVVVATPYQQRPPRFEYDLTAAGRDLAGRTSTTAAARPSSPSGSAPPATPPSTTRTTTSTWRDPKGNHAGKEAWGTRRSRRGHAGAGPPREIA